MSEHIILLMIKTHSTFPPILLITIVAVFSVVLNKLPEIWESNYWSIDFLKALTDQEISPDYLSEFPENHKRAQYWLTRQALAHNDIERATNLLNPSDNVNNVDYLSILGDILYLEGDYQGAIRSWSTAKDINSILDAAHFAEENENTDDALKAYQAVFELDMELGASLYANYLWNVANDKLAAEGVIRLALVTCPNSNKYRGWLHILGGILSMKEEWIEAEMIWNDLIAGNHEDIQAYRGLGWLYYYRGDGFEKALSVFQKVISLDPSLGDGYYDIARLYAGEGKYREADVWFLEAIERKPQVRWWWIERANNLRNARSLTAALLLYSETIQRYPEWSLVYYEIAWAYRLDNRLDEAILALEKAINLQQPQSFWPLVIAGNIYELEDRPEEALAAFIQALTLSPDNDAIIQAIARLTEANP